MSAALIIIVVIALAIATAVGLVLRRVLIDLAAERRRSEGRAAAAKESTAAAAARGCLSAFLFGIAPTLLFVLTYKFAPVHAAERIYVASAVLAFAVLVTLLVRLAKPLPNKPKTAWRNLTIIAMAGLTVALHDAFFVQVRPTVTNVISVLLAVGSLTGLSPRLEGMFNRESVSLDDVGWHKLVVGSLLLFIAMATANEYVRRFQSEAFWVYFQLWGPALLVAAFLIVGFFVIRRHMPAGQCPARPRAEQSEPSNDE